MGEENSTSSAGPSAAPSAPPAEAPPAYNPEVVPTPSAPPAEAPPAYNPAVVPTPSAPPAEAIQQSEGLVHAEPVKEPVLVYAMEALPADKEEDMPVLPALNTQPADEIAPAKNIPVLPIIDPASSAPTLSATPRNITPQQQPRLPIKNAQQEPVPNLKQQQKRFLLLRRTHELIIELEKQKKMQQKNPVSTTQPAKNKTNQQLQNLQEIRQYLLDNKYDNLQSLLNNKYNNNSALNNNEHDNKHSLNLTTAEYLTVKIEQGMNLSRSEQEQEQEQEQGNDAKPKPPSLKEQKKEGELAKLAKEGEKIAKLRETPLSMRLTKTN